MITKPIRKMDMDEQQLHEHLRQLTEKPKDVLIEGEDDEEEGDEEPISDNRVTIVPPPNKE